MAKLAIVAGSGLLPLFVARSAVASGWDIHVIAIINEAGCDFEQFEHTSIKLAAIGGFFQVLRQQQITDVVFAGAIANRPQLSDIRLNWDTTRLLPKLALAARGGDDSVLTTIASIIKAEGYNVIGVGDVAPNLLVPMSNLTRNKPNRQTIEDISYGAEVINGLSRFDVGQAVVVNDGRIWALEAAEGTAAMLERIIWLRQLKRIPFSVPTGVLVKRCKAGQDLRFDLPTIGSDTVIQAAAAGLRGIAIEGGKTIIIDIKKTTALADSKGLFINGKVIADLL